MQQKRGEYYMQDLKGLMLTSSPPVPIIRNDKTGKTIIGTSGEIKAVLDRVKLSAKSDAKYTYNW